MPTTKKNFVSFHLQKNPDDFSLVFFTIFTFIISKLLSGCPLVLDARGSQLFFSYFLCIYPSFCIYLYFFPENFLVGCPPPGCPGPSHPLAHPSARHWGGCIEAID